MDPISSLLREKLSLWPGHPVLPHEIEEAFAERCRSLFDHHARILATVVLVMTLAWWPTDQLVFRHFAEAFGLPQFFAAMNRWRIGIGVSTFFYVALPRPAFVRRHIIWAFFAVTGTCCWTAGSTAAMFGGLERPYFHMLYVIVFATVPLPLSLGPRLMLTLLMAVLTLAGYLGAHPEHRGSPFLPMACSFLTCVSLLSVWFGQVQFMLARENFFQAHELADYGSKLESRVTERTQELRRLLAHVETAREAERTRIARELHDELGQELSALRYSLGYTTRKYETEPEAIAANLAELDNLLRRTSTTTRGLVADLRPRVLDDLGLQAAAQWLIERTGQRGDMECRLTIDGTLGQLDDRVATAAFRVLQEALTNAARHSKAEHVEVHLTSRDGVLDLRISDDGIGLVAAQKRPEQSGGHFGLISMRERGLSLGGSVEVVERASGGTEVRCLLPLSPAASGTHDAIGN